MKLKSDIYYYCMLGKPTATIVKIRRYCATHECPHLGQRKKKNRHGKEARILIQLQHNPA